jgi:amidohydrolase
MLSDHNLDKLVQFRRELHQLPELAGEEKETSKIIINFLKSHKPDKIIKNIGGFGIAAVFEGEKSGPTICFRCDMDGLPIAESNRFDYKSKNNGVGHKCGHDGHMSMVSGLAIVFAEQRPDRGTIILLYQPAEETGEGAAKVIADDKFKQLKPDYIIGLHNLPKINKSAIVAKKGIFAAASRGIEIKLKGATSHAAEPENGRSPALAMAQIIEDITNLPNEENFTSYVLVTVVQAKLGEIAYGTTPGYAEVRATLRSYLDEDMDTLTKASEALIRSKCSQHQLDCEINYVEIFPATESDEKLAKILQELAENNNHEYINIEEPFRWSEDFGHYKKLASTLFFGLGAGNIPDLHHHDYDFPDQLIPTGTNIFHQLAQSLLNINK